MILSIIIIAHYSDFVTPLYAKYFAFILRCSMQKRKDCYDRQPVDHIKHELDYIARVYGYAGFDLVNPTALVAAYNPSLVS